MISCLITTTFFFFLQQGLCNVNVAINKTVMDCKGNNYHKLVDGRMDTFDTVSEMCGENKMKIKIKIEGPYFVHYVNLVDNECNQTHLVSFEVKSFGGNKCGRYYDMFGNCSTYRVNCIGVIIPSSTIVILLDAGPINLKEIEVFTLASGNPNEDILIYYGCFKDFISLTNSKNNNLSECRLFCDIGNHLFAAIEKLNCHCGFEVYEDLRVVQTYCKSGCYPDDEDCSGDDTYYSVYLLRVQLPYRYLCIENPPKLPKAFHSKDMSIEKCLRRCDDSQFALVLYDSVTTGCSCDNGTFDRYQHDHYRRCGKTRRNYLIYATCFDGISEKTKCSDLLMHCKDGWNMFGVCKGGCKRGFAGEQCLEKIMTSCDLGPCPSKSKCFDTIDGKNDFNCVCNIGYVKLSDKVCINGSQYCNFNACHKASSSCMRTTHGTYKCICKPGFVHKSNTKCVSENLCSFKNACTILNTRCVITGSRIKCICKDGYGRQDFKTDCHDIDECFYEPCNPIRSECLNEEGTFECLCRKGYTKLTRDTCSMNATSSFEQPFDSGFIDSALFLLIMPLSFGAVMLTIKLFIAYIGSD